MQLNKQNSELKLKVGREFLYFDVDEFMDNISYIDTVSGHTNIDIVVPKFEFFKAMIDTVTGIIEEADDTLGVVSMNKLSVPYKLALNTLIKYKIIKKL